MLRPDPNALPAPRRRHLPLLAIVVVALVLRVGLGFALPSDLAALPDQGEYLDLARSLADGRGLRIVDDRYAVPQVLLAQRMPGYPVILAGLGGSVTLVRLLQALAEASTCVAAYGIARETVGGRRAGLAAAALVAVNPFLAYFTTLVLTETLFTALVTWAMFAFLKARRDGRYWYVAAGLMLLATYLRPTGGPLLIALALAASILPARRGRWPIGPGLTAMLILALGLAPWAARNALALGRFVPTTTNAGITLYDGWQPDNNLGNSDQRFVEGMPQLSLMGEVDRSIYLRRKAMDAVKADPGRAISLAIKKVGRTWSPFPLSGGRWERIAGALYAIPVFLLAALGLVAAPGGRQGWRGRIFVIVPIGVITLLHAASVGSLRYRLPIEPLMAVLAAGGLAALVGVATATTARRRAYQSTTPDV